MVRELIIEAKLADPAQSTTESVDVLVGREMQDGLIGFIRRCGVLTSPCGQPFKL